MNVKGKINFTRLFASLLQCEDIDEQIKHTTVTWNSKIT